MDPVVLTDKNGRLFCPRCDRRFPADAATSFGELTSTGQRCGLYREQNAIRHHCNPTCGQSS